MNETEMLNDVSGLLQALQTDIGDDSRAPGCEDDDEPSMQVTIGVSEDGASWGWQTGDNSYSGGAYSFPYWGVVTLARDSDCIALAQDAIDQAFEQLS